MAGSREEKFSSGSYPYEDKSLSDELTENLYGDPNAGGRLLAISGLKDWSAREYQLVDYKHYFLKDFDVFHYSKLFDYVIDNYCSYSREELATKHIELSLMNSIANEYVYLYKSALRYKNEVIYLYNVFNRLLATMKPGGWIIVPSRF